MYSIVLILNGNLEGSINLLSENLTEKSYYSESKVTLTAKRAC